MYSRAHFEESVTESHDVGAIKAKRAAQSRGPQQCLSPGLALLWENKKGCREGKTGQYHSVFQWGILLYVFE